MTHAEKGPAPEAGTRRAPGPRPAARLRRLARRRDVRRALWFLAGFVAVALAAALWLVGPYLVRLGDIEAGLEHQPSRLYARPTVLEPGQRLSPGQLAEELELLGYRPAEKGADRTEAGRFRRLGDVLVARLRRSVGAESVRPPRLLTVRFAGGRIDGLRQDSRPVERFALDPPLLASFYGEEVRERYPVTLEELPEYVRRAVLAGEDAGFFRHPGISPTGVLRAAWVNTREGELAQGGSSLTQQLVKNVFLSHEKSWSRKIREAVLTVLVELGHSKEEILQAYLNQIYLGTEDGVNLHGLGAAARAYFGKHPSELDLGEAATLAGMIPAPADYSPLDHPEAARGQRDRVLGRMLELGWIGEEEHAAAVAEGVETHPLPLVGRRARHFARWVAEEARERYGISRLGDRGYRLVATLSLAEQEAAEAALARGLAALDGRGGGLEAALVSVDPRDGSVAAWVGGRDYERSEFDRVSQARRQAGSAFKPVVLAAALGNRTASLASRYEDAPLVMRAGGRAWSPENHDGRFLGDMTVRRAIEESRNLPVVRLAQDTGLSEIAELARELGVEGRLDAVPALSLGAFEVTPKELATVYSTFATGGLRPEVHGVEAVYDARGEPVEGRSPAGPERVLSPEVAHLVTSVLQGVVDRGTGRGLARWGVDGVVAGKTGTSNRARDSWFAGYRPDRATVVWVGYDRPRPTRLGGSRAALPIWGRYARSGFPPDDELAFEEPEGLVHETLCTVSGLQPRSYCPTREELLLPGQEPEALCDVHVARPRRHRDRDDGGGSWLVRKLRKIFGDG